MFGIFNQLTNISWQRWSLDPDIHMHNMQVSDLQLEAVAYACQQHEIIRSDGYRLGFFIGDGAVSLPVFRCKKRRTRKASSLYVRVCMLQGVGKGRECAAIIFNAWLQGHRKALWFSTSSDLWCDCCPVFHCAIYPV